MELTCHFCGKGFFRDTHQINKHLSEGRIHFFCSLSCSSKFTRSKQKKEDILRYNADKKLCKSCKNCLPYERRRLTFCSSSCSVTFNNKKSWNGVRRSKHSKTMKEFWSNRERIPKTKKLRFCKICNKGSLDKRKQICEGCRFDYYHVYRPLCEFRFDLNSYPNKFDLDEFLQYGFYSPKNKKNNPIGVSRDHLYTVKDGFDNKIDPTVIRHPANCSLIRNEKNQSKGRKSSITLEELLERIKNW